MAPLFKTESLSLCDVCHQKESIYRCPKCFARTCCLSCCLTHKEESNCDGKRDRTAFVPLHQFKDTTLKSDYYFLEDVLNKSNRGKRLIRDLGLDKHQRGSGMGGNKRKRMTTNEDPDSADHPSESMPIHPLSQLNLDLKDEKVSSQNGNGTQNSLQSLVTMPPAASVTSSKETHPNLSQYPKTKQRLVQKAKERNINLLLMPPGMQRHILNKTTKYDAKNDVIYWKVEFVFHRINGQGQGQQKGKRNNESSRTSNHNVNKHNKLVLTIDRIAENEEVTPHLEKTMERNILHSEASNNKTRSMLKAFVKASDSEYVTLMKRIPCALSKPLYSKVNIRSTIGDVLKGTSVIEFPTIEVVLKEDLEHFPLVIKEM